MGPRCKRCLFIRSEKKGVEFIRRTSLCKTKMRLCSPKRSRWYLGMGGFRRSPVRSPTFAHENYSR
ncbi:hypothetical protein PBCV1_A260aR [Paramecium bursaria Chlorella virus 1]|uniref:Uncharacterized protein n=1 Tax=Paramecium bursaria Chlorella virus 1 TaxID=10506 RepID=O41019_PBCV1|nr:hypothetical protein PBCV1_A260aR [Paramecium bursaria Chlorella virus 1]AAC97066.3 hypothetical protein [Paramecium bursaria Chlorella virus 1]